MLKFVWIILIFQSYLFPLEINNKTTFNELLSHTEIYKDYNQSDTILTIQNKAFKPYKEKILGCGYSPKYNVWIRFTLTNTTSHSIKKIIEYANPLTSYIEFFEENKLVKKDGLLNVSKDRKSLNPIFKITLEPHQSKEFYIKVYSKITTLIIKLNVWSIEKFNQKELQNKLVLAIFFGAMGIIVFYNIITSIITKGSDYLYFILFFMSVSFHHFMYKGIATLFFSSETMERLIYCSSCIVGIPTIFLILFTQQILKLENYQKLYRSLKYILLLYPIVIVSILITGENIYRSFFVTIILLYLFGIAGYTFLKTRKKHPFLFFSWMLFITSGIFMYLSSLGVYDIFIKYPYYLEFIWIFAIIMFSLTLFISKIRSLKEAKAKAQKSESTLAESKHRFANNMQSILNFLLLQRKNTKDKNTKEIFRDLENRIMATTELDILLHTQGDKVVSIENYFSAIIERLQENFKQNHIKIDINSKVNMHADTAVYCGQIVNEAVTNAFKYAFSHLESGKIDIFLTEQEEQYHLLIKDNGQGFDKKSSSGLGLDIIKTLATLQLEGILDIKQKNGVEIDIKWRRVDEE